MPATMRQLLGDPSLSLRLLTLEPELPERALEVPVSWVHSSDLTDPTPFLDEGHVLLTTGTQFGDEQPDAHFAAYVQRLSACGVTGLGFGREVVRDGTPARLVSECARQGVPLFEVPYRTPFIAVARRAADAIARDSYSRHTWALGAQSAISLAATQGDGLVSALRELARQLGSGVALWGPGGSLEAAAAFTSPSADGDIEREVAQMLRAGRRASATMPSASGFVSLQTVSAATQLRGVLGVISPKTLDREAQQVVTGVVGLAGLALEQRRSLDAADARLQSGVLRLLERGEVDLAATLLSGMGKALPEAPVRVAVTAWDEASVDELHQKLELHTGGEPGSAFFAIDDGQLILVISEHRRDSLDPLARSLDAQFGVSEQATWSELRRSIRQARIALDSTRDDVGVSYFGDVSARSVLGMLSTANAAEVARAVLAPLADHDRTHGGYLLETGRRWLLANGEFEAAARGLGVHRHTVRSRVSQIEKLLGRDLSAFAHRAELWSAYIALGHDADVVVKSDTTPPC